MRPRSRPEYDVVVVGGGAAGLVAAVIGASLGAKTALVERDRLGGDCTWHGCIPSKTLLHEATRAQQRGTPPNWSEIRARLNAVRERIYTDADAPDVLARYGVEVVPGTARFEDRHGLRVQSVDGERLLTSRIFLICTGSRPRLPVLDVPYLTTESVFELTQLPSRLVIAGAGPAGIELAQAFARLGCDVTVVERGAGILSRDDREHAGELCLLLAADGVRFAFNAEISAASGDAAGLSVRLSSGADVRCDQLLIAGGRAPRVDGLGLDRAGVIVRDGTIVVNDACRTSVANIYATGDVGGPPYFTHAAEEMSKVAMSNALLKLPRRYRRTLVPWCTFTSHELAHVGETEAALAARGVRYDVLRFENSALDRAITDAATAGSTKLFVGKRGRIYGASILSPRAGEVAATIALAMRAALPVSRLSDLVLPYPTYAYGVRRAADEWYARLLTPRLRRMLQLALRLRGQR